MLTSDSKPPLPHLLSFHSQGRTFISAFCSALPLQSRGGRLLCIRTRQRILCDSWATTSANHQRHMHSNVRGRVVQTRTKLSTPNALSLKGAARCKRSKRSPPLTVISGKLYSGPHLHEDIVTSRRRHAGGRLLFGFMNALRKSCGGGVDLPFRNGCSLQEG